MTSSTVTQKKGSILIFSAPEVGYQRTPLEPSLAEGLNGSVGFHPDHLCQTMPVFISANRLVTASPVVVFYHEVAWLHLFKLVTTLFMCVCSVSNHGLPHVVQTWSFQTAPSNSECVSSSSRMAQIVCTSKVDQGDYLCFRIHNFICFMYGLKVAF